MTKLVKSLAIAGLTLGAGALTASASSFANPLRPSKYMTPRRIMLPASPPSAARALPKTSAA